MTKELEEKYKNDMLKHYCDKLEERLIEQDELHKEEMKEMAECIERFEKALDKACGLLARQSSCYACQLQECIRKDYEFVCTMDEWKEWLLKDE